MTQTDTITKVSGYTINKYCILQHDIIVTQSNYHFFQNVTEVYTTGWPIDNSPESELHQVVAVWYNKSIHYTSRVKSNEPGEDWEQNAETGK
jgi:hypothetical protein